MYFELSIRSRYDFKIWGMYISSQCSAIIVILWDYTDYRVFL